MSNKLFPDKFDEIFAEENQTESSYGLQVMKAMIQRLAKRVDDLEKEVGVLKLTAAPGFVGFNYVPSLGVSGVMPSGMPDYSISDMPLSGLHPSLQGLSDDDNPQYFQLPWEYTTT